MIKFTTVKRLTGLLFRPLLALALVSVSGSLGAQGRRPEAPPIIREAEFSGHPCLALEDVAKAMHGEVAAAPPSDGVTLSFGPHRVVFTLQSTQAMVNGEATTLEAPVVKDNRAVWVPRSFFHTGPIAAAFQERIDLGPIDKPAKSVIPKGDAATPKMAETPQAAGEQVVVSVSTSRVTAASPAPPADAPEPPHAIRRIVIDPGHGGKDPGAIGVRGTEEKAVNLWMSQELADTLRERDFEVLLTRTDDTFIPLAERAALANRYKADLFISLHCNASLSSKLKGFEVYILSEKASDPRAEAVARLENAALELEEKTSASVQAVLRSLIKNANINRSAQLAGIIDREVSQNLTQGILGVRQAAFYVLRGAQMPAVLVELGFLSNRSEERRLQDKAYRQRLIRAIEASIVEFDRKQKEVLQKG